MRRLPASLISLAFVCACIWPVFRAPPRDSFPLSDYPMFSSVRGRAWIHVVVAVDENGNQRSVPPRLVANAEVMQAAQTIAKAVRRGDPARQRLCREVADRLARELRWREYERVELLSRKFAPMQYFVDGPDPIEERRQAVCRIDRIDRAPVDRS